MQFFYSENIMDEIRPVTSQTCVPSTSANEISVNEENKTFRWRESSIKLLLDIRLSKEKQFAKPNCKKSKLWREIATEMFNITRTEVASDMCDSKYRNLLSTYRTNKKKQLSTGESNIKWGYFDIFDRVLGHKPRVHRHQIF